MIHKKSPNFVTLLLGLALLLVAAVMVDAQCASGRTCTPVGNLTDKIDRGKNCVEPIMTALQKNSQVIAATGQVPQLVDPRW